VEEHLSSGPRFQLVGQPGRLLDYPLHLQWLAGSQEERRSFTKLPKGTHGVAGGGLDVREILQKITFLTY